MSVYFVVVVVVVFRWKQVRQVEKAFSFSLLFKETMKLVENKLAYLPFRVWSAVLDLI